MASMAAWGGVALHVHLMLGMGLVMMLVFIYIFFVPYATLKNAVAAQDWPAGGRALAGIRRLVTFNLVLGILTVIVATGGVYWSLPM